MLHISISYFDILKTFFETLALCEEGNFYKLYIHSSQLYNLPLNIYIHDKRHIAIESLRLRILFINDA